MSYEDPEEIFDEEINKFFSEEAEKISAHIETKKQILRDDFERRLDYLNNEKMKEILLENSFDDLCNSYEGNEPLIRENVRKIFRKRLRDVTEDTRNTLL